MLNAAPRCTSDRKCCLVRGPLRVGRVGDGQLAEVGRGVAACDRGAFRRGLPSVNCHNREPIHSDRLCKAGQMIHEKWVMRGQTHSRVLIMRVPPREQHVRAIPSAAQIIGTQPYRSTSIEYQHWNSGLSHNLCYGLSHNFRGSPNVSQVRVSQVQGRRGADGCRIDRVVLDRLFH